MAATSRLGVSFTNSAKESVKIFLSYSFSSSIILANSSAASSAILIHGNASPQKIQNDGGLSRFS
jgi:hypothetical protein